MMLAPGRSSNEDVLVKHLQADVEGVRWSLDPANKETALKLLMDRLKLAEDVAAAAYTFATDPAGKDLPRTPGLTSRASATCSSCARQADLGTPGGTPPAPEKYLDRRHYEKASAGL